MKARICRLFAVASTILIACLTPARAAGPELFSITPNSAPAGAKLSVQGKGLKDSQQVLFVFDGRANPADFKTVSDRELEVVATNCLTAGTTATLLVITAQGATVGLPPGAKVVRDVLQTTRSRAFCHVLEGGSVAQAESPSFIEEGGIVADSAKSDMHFVKKGGALLRFRNPDGLVVHEPGAILGDAIKSSASLQRIETPKLNPSLGIEPFVFAAAPRPQGARRRRR